MHRAAAQRARESGVRRFYYVKSKYGITWAEYARLQDVQQGRCACCGQPPPGGKRLYVDHDHVTSVVRGLLCQGCNSGIGMLGENPERLRRAAAYLERAPLRAVPHVRINLLGGERHVVTA